MPTPRNPAFEAPMLAAGAQQDVYQLQDIPHSPTRRSPQRIRHFHDDEDALDEAEKFVFEDTRSESSKDPSPHQGSLYFTLAEEQAVVRKFDRRLVLFIALLYMLGFLDRSST